MPEKTAGVSTVSTMYVIDRNRLAIVDRGEVNKRLAYLYGLQVIGMGESP
jgi:hypothetical protein